VQGVPCRRSGQPISPKAPRVSRCGSSRRLSMPSLRSSGSRRTLPKRGAHRPTPLVAALAAQICRWQWGWLGGSQEIGRHSIHSQTRCSQSVAARGRGRRARRAAAYRGQRRCRRKTGRSLCRYHGATALALDRIAGAAGTRRLPGGAATAEEPPRARRSLVKIR